MTNRQSSRHMTRRFESIKEARKTHVCAREMLRPLLRVLLAAGLTERQLVAICTDSVRQTTQHAATARLEPLLNRRPLELIVWRWTNHDAFLDKGVPARLRFKGAKPSFRTLVRSVSARYSPSAALQELKRKRVVRIAQDGKVELLSRFYPILSRSTVDIEAFSQMTTDFLRAHEFNLLRKAMPGRGLFQRVAHNVNSDLRLAPTFNRYAREKSQLFLEAIDEWLVRHQPKRTGVRRKRKVRLGIGIYVINEALR